MDKKLNIMEAGCPECQGDLYLDYKHGQMNKCLRCRRVFTPGDPRIQLEKRRRKCLPK